MQFVYQQVAAFFWPQLQKSRLLLLSRYEGRDPAINASCLYHVGTGPTLVRMESFDAESSAGPA